MKYTYKVNQIPDYRNEQISCHCSSSLCELYDISDTSNWIVQWRYHNDVIIILKVYTCTFYVKLYVIKC